jgi:hypothetical protein
MRLKTIRAFLILNELYTLKTAAWIGTNIDMLAAISKSAYPAPVEMNLVPVSTP